MSSIAGVYQLDDRPADVELVDRMARISVEPYVFDCWTNGPVAFSYSARTRNPQFGKSTEPFAHLQIVSDLRIDNRSEVASKLPFFTKTSDWKSISDEELVLYCYVHWGADFPQHLIGDFAIVIWDDQRKILFATRDCYGMRPLYYFFDRRKILFGSQISQLLLDPSIPKELNEDVVQDWLLLGFLKNPEQTFFKSIVQVPGGHSMIVSHGALQFAKYWSWKTPRNIRYRDERQYVDHLLEVLTEAIGCRLSRSGPTGLMLSGGLDSSTIAGIAAGILVKKGRSPREFRGYSQVFDNLPSVDERSYIKETVDFLKIESIYLYPEKFQAFSGHWIADEPISSDSFDPSWKMALLDLKEQGGDTMLTGHAGETVFLGPTVPYNFADWFLNGRWIKLIHEARMYESIYERWPKLRWPHVLKMLVRLIPQSLYPRLPIRRQSLPPWMTTTPTQQRSRIIRWRHVRRPRLFSHFSKQYAFESVAGDSVAPTLWLSNAQSGKRLGIEYAHPFMDRRLHEYVFALPLHLFFENGQDRAILRKALKGLLPDRTRTRLIGTYFDEWIKSHTDDQRFVKILRDSAVTNNRQILSMPDHIDNGQLEKYRYNLIWACFFATWYDNNLEVRGGSL